MPLIFQEKPKEKTIFNVKLESFDAASKPKVIKEVKAMVPNLTLIEVRLTNLTLVRREILTHPPNLGEEVCRVVTEVPQGEYAKGGGREAQESL